MRKPGPVFVSRILRKRHRHAVWKVETRKAFPPGGLFSGTGHTGKGLEPRQRESDSGTTKEAPAVEGCEIGIQEVAFLSTANRL